MIHLSKGRWPALKIILIGISHLNKGGNRLKGDALAWFIRVNIPQIKEI